MEYSIKPKRFGRKENNPLPSKEDNWIIRVFMIALMIFIGFCIFNGGRIRESEKNKEVITDTTF